MFRFLFYNAHQRRLRCFWRLFLHAVITLVVLLGVAAVAVLITGTASRTWLEEAAEPAAVILTVLVAARYLDRRHWRDLGLGGSRRFWEDLAVGLVLGGVLIGLVVLAAVGLGWAAPAAGARANGGSPATVWSLCSVIALYVVVGVGEELLFRGYWLRNIAEGLCGWLRPQGAAWTAVAGTSLLFASAHLLNDHVSLLAWFNTLLAGLGLALTVALTGRLALVVGFHITWNAVQSIAFGLPVSGKPPDVAIWTFTLDGPVLWTGGAYGPESGLLGTLAFVLLILFALAWSWRREGKIARGW